MRRSYELSHVERIDFILIDEQVDESDRDRWQMNRFYREPERWNMWTAGLLGGANYDSSKAIRIEAEPFHNHL
jgi:hypothetical protein